MKLREHYTFRKHSHHWNGFTWSDGNTKQDRVLNFSMEPKHTCPADAPCRKENGGSCYFQATEDFRPSVALAAQRNYERYAEDPEAFWQSFDKAVVYALKHKIGIRMFDGGDIPDYEFLCRLIEKTKAVPHLTHEMTKQYGYINRYIAEHGEDKSAILDFVNMRMSEWDGYPMPNPYSMPVFSRRMTEQETTCLEQRAKMIGKEWSCKDCFDHMTGCYAKDHRSIYCIDHKEESKIVRKRGLWKSAKKGA